MYALELQVALLKHQLELEESNLKYAIELQKDYNTLKRIRDNIGVLKEILSELIQHTQNCLQNKNHARLSV